MRARAAFLDRDGTLIEDVHHLARPDQVRVLPGVSDALRTLRAEGYLLVIVTNQSGVARGYFSEADVASVHARLGAMLGLSFDAILVCPHHPEGTVPAYARACDCRKPATGLLERAIRELDLEPGACFVVGDKASDIEAGRRLGIPGYRVRTGKGASGHGHRFGHPALERHAAPRRRGGGGRVSRPVRGRVRLPRRQKPSVIVSARGRSDDRGRAFADLAAVVGHLLAPPPT